MTVRRRRLWLAVAALVLCFGALVAWLNARQSDALRAFQVVKPGMTVQEVESAIGGRNVPALGGKRDNRVSIVKKMNDDSEISLMFQDGQLEFARVETLDWRSEIRLWVFDHFGF